MIGVEYLWSR